MKKIFSIALAVLLFNATFAQAPNHFSYQAVARNSGGDVLKNQSLGIEFSIRPNSALDAPIYTETHSTSTNEYGLFTLQVGTGTATLGSFNSIDWSTGNYWLEVGMDNTGGTSYTSMGTQQLLSVPFANYANVVANTDDADADPMNETNTSLTIQNDTLKLSDNAGTLEADLAEYRFSLSNPELQVYDCYPIGTDLSATYDGIFNNTFGSDFWQSFTANSNGDLNQLRWRVGDQAMISGTMELYEGEGTGGTLLGSWVLGNTGVDMRIPIDISPTIPMVQGMKYTIRVFSPSDFSWSGRSGDPYPGGQSSVGINKDQVFRARIANACVDSTMNTINVDSASIQLTNVSSIVFINGSSLDSVPPDDQQLSLVDDLLAIEDGNSVDLSPVDDQQLNLVGSALSIDNGNSVDLSVVDDQQLNLAADVLSIDNGNSVDLSVYTQDLSLSGDVLSIENANSVDLSAYSLPVGTIQMYIGSTAPAGWLLCDGSTFNAGTYPTLNTLLGGNTLPDMRGRFPLGSKFPVNPGETPYPMDSYGGEETHTLTIAEMPSHDHNIQYSEGSESGSSSPYSDLSGTGSVAQTQQRGGGQPHNNMPPFYTLNFIIKAN